MGQERNRTGVIAKKRQKPGDAPAVRGPSLRKFARLIKEPEEWRAPRKTSEEKCCDKDKSFQKSMRKTCAKKWGMWKGKQGEG